MRRLRGRGRLDPDDDAKSNDFYFIIFSLTDIEQSKCRLNDAGEGEKERGSIKNINFGSLNLRHSVIL